MLEFVPCITYWHGTLEKEWAPKFLELVDIEVFCDYDHRRKAYKALDKADDWRECEDRANLLIGPPVNGEEEQVFLAMLEDKGASVLAGSQDFCGWCEDPIYIDP